MAIFTGIAAAVTAIGGWIGGLGAIGGALLKAAVGIGVSLLAQKLAGKPSQAESRFSINTSLSGGGGLPRFFIMGIAATGGSLVWANTWGTVDGAPNAWLTQVIALSDLPIKGLTELWVDGKKVSYDYGGNSNHPNGYSVPEFENEGPNLYIKIYDGTQTTADQQLILQDSTGERSWDSNRVGTGVAYAIVRSRATRNLFSGVPTFTFVVDGMRLYDVSRDSTRGGDGPQRFNDRSTWGGDGDYLPAVQIYNLFRGITYANQWVFGLQGVNEGRLPSSNWIAQINKCRATYVSNSGPVPTYRSGGVFDVSAQMSDAVENLLTSCQGKIAEAGGIYTLNLGEPETPLFSITDDDIISTEGQEFSPFYGISDSINGVVATYPEPSEGWEEKTAPPLFRPDLEALDGNRRLLASVQFALVPYAEQVQRLMKSALLASLRQRRHTITLPPKFWRFCLPGETLYFTSERNGYSSKVFVIDGVSDKANLDVVIDISEYDPGDYSWSSDTEYQPPVIGETGPIVPPGQSVKDFAAVPWEVKDDQGRNRRPAIRITWDNSLDVIAGVSGVEWQIRPLGVNVGTQTLDGATSIPEAGAVIVQQGILPDTFYEVRARFIPTDGDRLMVWSGWLQVRTFNILLTELDVYTDGLVEEIQGSVADSLLFTRDYARQAILEAQRLARLTADQDFGNFGDRQKIKREISSSYDRAKAAWSEEITVATSPISALSQRIESLDVRLSGDIASATESLTVLIRENEAGLEALSQQTTSLIADLSGDLTSAVETLTVRINQNGDDIEAISQQTTELIAEVQGSIAESINVLTASVEVVEGQVTSISDSITSLTSTVGSSTANGLFRVQSLATPTDAQSRIGLSVSATANGVTKDASIYLDALASGKSRFLAIADQFAFVVNDSPEYPFVVDSGGLRANFARVGTIRSGRLLSLNEKMEINLDAGTILIRS